MSSSKKSPSEIVEKQEVLQVETDEKGDWYELKKRELYVVRPPTWGEYDIGGATFAEMRDSVPFWIGDYINIGEEMFGEMYTQALVHFGEYEYQTVANYASVMRRVPARVGKEQHRRKELSFAHHDAVAKLEIDEQRYWLQRAVDEKLTSRELRELINPEEDAEPRSFWQELDDLILDLHELKTIAPPFVVPYLQTALDALYDGKTASAERSESKVAA